MSTETTVVDPVQAILVAAFGPDTAVEVGGTSEVEKEIVYVKASNGSTYREVEVPALKLDGTPKKRTQSIEVTSGFGAEAKRELSETRVLVALANGAEALADIQAATGLAKLTITRALERLVASGRAVSTKAPPSGRRGRPAHLYRSAVEIVSGSVESPSTDSKYVETPTTSLDPVSGPINGIVVGEGR